MSIESSRSENEVPACLRALVNSVPCLCLFIYIFDTFFFVCLFTLQLVGQFIARAVSDQILSKSYIEGYKGRVDCEYARYVTHLGFQFPVSCGLMPNSWKSFKIMKRFKLSFIANDNKVLRSYYTKPSCFWSPKKWSLQKTSSSWSFVLVLVNKEKCWR